MFSIWVQFWIESPYISSILIVSAHKALSTEHKLIRLPISEYIVQIVQINYYGDF
jgi:hypothetical protein